MIILTKKRKILSFLMGLISLQILAAENDYPIKPVLFTDVQIKDNFWYSRMETNRKVTIPFAFKKCEETGRIDNFCVAGRLKKGVFTGRRYNDSDVFKVMEGASYSLSVHPDPGLEKYMDNLIAKISAAQEKDGYLFTARTIDPENPAEGAGKKRWSNLASSHELYNVGHMYEAAIAYFLATGKHSFLDVARKNADFIAKTFGPDKMQGFPGHQEIEIGLVKLFRITGKQEYLKLAKFFLDQRGFGPDRKYFPESSPFSVYNEKKYMQAHLPVIKQNEAVGHAVRAMYMYSGMADIAAIIDDKDYLKAIDKIWNNVVSKKLYITGGVGARHTGEAFGDNYELPNLTAYNETCAAIGNVMWNHRMFLLKGESKYIDVMELTLYNGLISGVSRDGKHFFYPNPLESNNKYNFNQGAKTRKPWFDCACCPVNIARFIPSFPGYIYAFRDDHFFVNLYVSSKGKIPVGGQKMGINQHTDYPWKGKVKITVNPQFPAVATLHLRIPGWAKNRPVPSDLYRFLDKNNRSIVVRLNRQDINPEVLGGYFIIRRKWIAGDTIEMVLPMPVRRVICHPKVKNNQGKVSLMRGPIVYCLEGVDNGGEVLNLKLPDKSILFSEFQKELLGGVTIIRGNTLRVYKSGGIGTVSKKKHEFKAIPYHVWSHRGEGEMVVWLPRIVEDLKQ